MAFQVSPGVNVSEISAQTVVPNVGTSVACLAGTFQWGPVDEIQTLASELEEVNIFGKPNNDTASTWFSGANFLSYGGALNVVRVVGAKSFNAITGATGSFLIKNKVDYDNLAAELALGYGYTAATGVPGASGATGAVPGTPYNFTWAAKYPGVLGNSLQVSIADSQSYTNWAYKSYFQSAPNTSPTALNPNANDELHVIVIDQDGLFSGTPGSVLETFGFVSKASDAKSITGEDNYYVDVINRQSLYIWWAGHTTGATGAGLSWGSASPGFGATGFKGATAAITESLAKGTDDNVNTPGILQDGYAQFLPETVECDLLIAGEADSATVTYLIDDVAEVRKDCVVLFSPPKSATVNNVGNEPTDIAEYAQVTVNPNSSYAFMDGNWKYQYDRYNDVYRWLPLNGDVAGLCAYTDQVRDPWFSPAGYNRGVIKNVVKLAWNPNHADRDILYQAGVNPVIAQPGLGTILFGDKTMLAKPSPFDRINVRRLFIVLEKAISTAAKFSLFELNNTATRAQFVGAVVPYLKAVEARDGIYDFKVVCDESNNTPQVIDSNSFVGDIYIKPARSINYIQLNFVAVGTGVSFSEVVGNF